MAVAFKLENCIHHMLEYLRTCDLAVFGNMPDQENRSIALFRKAEQLSGTFPYLGYTAGS